MKLLGSLFSAFMLVFGAGTAQAADYPNRPIRVVVGYSPGGATDIVARVVADKLSSRFGQSVIVENRPGAGGNIAAAGAAKAAPDGYTLYFVTIATAISATYYDNLQYNLANDFAAVSQASAMPSFLVVHPSLGVHSVKELIALAKSRPGQLDFSSSGMGGSPHLSGEMFKIMTGVDMTHIAYKGTVPQVTDLLSGVVKVAFPTMPGVIEHIKSGKLRALAVNSKERNAVAPDVPTMAEAGVPGFVDEAWNGIMVPTGTPKDIVNLLSAEIVKIMAMPDVQEKLAAVGTIGVSSTPEDFDAYIKAEVRKWGEVVKTANVNAKP